MKLRGLKQLKRKISTLIHQIDASILVRIGASDSSIPSDNVVTFGILRDSVADNDFMENLRATHSDAPTLPVYIYALLHEIGHCKTKEYLELEQEGERAKIMKEGSSEEYFRLPAEVAATQWAVDYAKNNEERMYNMEIKIEAIVYDFRQAN